jgi:hypothetical protein
MSFCDLIVNDRDVTPVSTGLLRHAVAIHVPGSPADVRRCEAAVQPTLSGWVHPALDGTDAGPRRQAPLQDPHMPTMGQPPCT